MIPVERLEPYNQIGPYKLESCLAKGKWSILYLGRDPHNLPVVVKILVQSDKEAHLRFSREVEILNKVSHPYIVKIVGHGIWEAMPYIAMEALEGASLREWILHRPFSLSQALHLILDIAYALCHLHTHGVVHRDLKPENILLTNDRLPKLLDFGIAQLLVDQGKQKEQEPSPAFMGTPVYMSPEQRDHPEYVSYASDVYSLGIIAYEVILGRLSHGHISLSLMPKGIQKILRKMLQPNFQDRYADVVDFIVDLSSYLNGPQFIEESRGLQPCYSFWDQLQRSLQTFFHLHLPPSSFYIGGIGCRDRTTTWGVYVDHIALAGENELLIVAESVKPGAEGLIAVSALRARLAILRKSNSYLKDLQQIEKNMLQEGSLEGFFYLHLLYFSKQDASMAMLSFGTEGIGWIEEGKYEAFQQHEALFGMAKEADIVPAKKLLTPGRRFIVTTRYVLHEQPKYPALYTASAWQERILQTAHFPPQEQADLLMKPSPRHELVEIDAPLQGCIVLQTKN